MPPYSAYLVFGYVYNSLGSIIHLARLKVTTSVGTKIYYTNSDGIFMYDLADIGYVSGETVAVEVTEIYNNEFKSHTYVVSGFFLNENITTFVRTQVERISELQRQNVLHTVGKTPVTKENTLPIGMYAFNGTSFKEVRIDSSTRALKIIDYSHSEVHDGSSFWNYNNVTLGNGEINTVSIQTPNTAKWFHLLLQISSSVVATFDVLEDVTSLAGGASFTALNFNRNSSKKSGCICKVGDTPGANPLIPTGGNTIWNETLGVKGIVTSRENASELILKQNSIYLFRITNGATSNNCTILLNWYEHTDKEA